MLLVCLCAFLVVHTYYDDLADRQLTDNRDIYFNEVVFRTEFGSSSKTIRKWTRDIRIFVAGNPSDALSCELNKVIGELNELVSGIQLTLVDSEDKSNLIAFFGSGDGYLKFEPKAKPYIEELLGFVWLNWDSQSEIQFGSIFVDTVKTQSIERQRHIVREELTQALGIMNDSYRYPNSIFYDG